MQILEVLESVEFLTVRLLFVVIIGWVWEVSERRQLIGIGPVVIADWELVFGVTILLRSKIGRLGDELDTGIIFFVVIVALRGLLLLLVGLLLVFAVDD